MYAAAETSPTSSHAVGRTVLIRALIAPGNRSRGTAQRPRQSTVRRQDVEHAQTDEHDRVEPEGGRRCRRAAGRYPVGCLRRTGSPNPVSVRNGQAKPESRGRVQGTHSDAECAETQQPPQPGRRPERRSRRVHGGAHRPIVSPRLLTRCCALLYSDAPETWRRKAVSEQDQPNQPPPAGGSPGGPVYGEVPRYAVPAVEPHRTHRRTAPPPSSYPPVGTEQPYRVSRISSSISSPIRERSSSRIRVHPSSPTGSRMPASRTPVSRTPAGTVPRPCRFTRTHPGTGEWAHI